MKALNYYERLRVTRNATPEEIKRNYRKLAQIFHPDKTNGDPTAEESFKFITEAYECLSDQNKRAEYDKKTFTEIRPDIIQIPQPQNASADTPNPLWKVAALGGIIWALDALLSENPKPKRRKKKKVVAKMRKQTTKRK